MQLFSQRQKGQLDVYGLWGVLRGQLLTDDSFVFNKVLKRIRESIEHLSDATEEDEDALLRVKVHTLPLALVSCREWRSGICTWSTCSEAVGSTECIVRNHSHPVQERLQAEGAEQPEAAEAEAAPEEGPAAEPNEADPFGLDQIIEKEEATK